MHESIVYKHCLPEKKNSCQVVNFQHAYRYIVSVMTRLASYVVIFIKALIRYLCSY